MEIINEGFKNTGQNKPIFPLGTIIEIRNGVEIILLPSAFKGNETMKKKIENSPVSLTPGLPADRIRNFLGQDSSETSPFQGLPADMIRKFEQTELLKKRFKKGF
jgi:hypothetical protein